VSDLILALDSPVFPSNHIQNLSRSIPILHLSKSVTMQSLFNIMFGLESTDLTTNLNKLYLISRLKFNYSQPRLVQIFATTG